MKLNIIHRTTQNLGDHGESVSIAIEPNEYESVGMLVEKVLTPKQSDGTNQKPIYHEWIEIRIVKEPEPEPEPEKVPATRPVNEDEDLPF